MKANIDSNKLLKSKTLYIGDLDWLDYDGSGFPYCNVDENGFVHDFDPFTLDNIAGGICAININKTYDEPYNVVNIPICYKIDERGYYVKDVPEENIKMLFIRDGALKINYGEFNFDNQSYGNDIVAIYDERVEKTNVYVCQIMGECVFFFSIGKDESAMLEDIYVFDDTITHLKKEDFSQQIITGTTNPFCGDVYIILTRNDKSTLITLYEWNDYRGSYVYTYADADELKEAMEYYDLNEPNIMQSDDMVLFDDFLKN